MIVATLLMLLAGDVAAAEEALAAKEPEKALALLGDADDVRAKRVRGRAYLALADYEAALDPLLTVLEATPDDKELLRDVAWACWGASRAGGPFAKAYLEDALRHAQKAKEAAMVADLLYELSRWDEALSAYKTLPDKLHARVRIAHCLAVLERKDEAKAAYGKALEGAMEQKAHKVAFDVAWRSKQTGRYLAWMDTCLKAEPDNLDLRMYRATMRDALRMWKESAEDYRAAVKIRPDYEAAWSLLARSLFLTGSADQDPPAIQEAEEIATKMLLKKPWDKVAWKTLHWVSGYAWANADVPRTYRTLQLLHKTDPTDISVALSLCGMARRLEKYDEAEQVFREMLDQDPEDPDLLNDFAILEDGRGRRAAAIALWKRVLEVDESNLNALENLFTKTWEDGDDAAMRDYLKRGLAAAIEKDDEALIQRWKWFEDRLQRATRGFKSE